MNAKAYYMERDFVDHKYKILSQIPKGNDYTLGEIFLIAETESIPKHIKVKAIVGEKVLYDEFVYLRNNGIYFEFKLVFTESKITHKKDLIFRAYKLNNTESNLPHVWIMFEEYETVRTLDALEETHHYNLLGDTNFNKEEDREYWAEVM